MARSRSPLVNDARIRASRSSGSAKRCVHQVPPDAIKGASAPSQAGTDTSAVARRRQGRAARRRMPVVRGCAAPAEGETQPRPAGSAGAGMVVYLASKPSRRRKARVMYAGGVAVATRCAIVPASALFAHRGALVVRALPPRAPL
eukprot:scaffold48786_cov61-Phaeocystis_antarctica.AAC.8